MLCGATDSVLSNAVKQKAFFKWDIIKTFYLVHMTAVNCSMSHENKNVKLLVFVFFCQHSLKASFTTFVGCVGMVVLISWR